MTVSITGGGAGTVTSSPAGISCGSDCSESYAYNTAVTLTATPYPVLSAFTGWSGDCTGTGSCVVTMDHEGRIVDFNPAAERTFGFRAGHPVGGTMAELIFAP